MTLRLATFGLLAATALVNSGCGILWGCKRTEVTAVSLNPADQCLTGHGHCHGLPEVGIPFYLPKPLLIVSKNFRNVEEAKVGLTDSAPIPNYLDDQAKYADVNARTSWTPVHMTASGQAPSGASGAQTFPTGTTGSLATASGPRVFAGGAPVAPGVVPSDGLTPETFYTYQIVFVPDLTQKYGLKIKGGAGEIRAALNMVNGWMFTGLGPFYMKDSSTAQNVLANGIASNLTLGGAADVLNSIQNLRGAVGGGSETTGGAKNVTPTEIRECHEKIVTAGFTQNSIINIPNFAEIHIYEPYLVNGQMEWRLVTQHCFNREFLGTVTPAVTRTITVPGVVIPPPKEVEKKDGSETSGKPGLQLSGAPGANQLVNVNCGQPDAPCLTPRRGPVVRLLDACKLRKPQVNTTIRDQEVTPEQFDAVLNKTLLSTPAGVAPPPAVVPVPVQFPPKTSGLLPKP